MVRKEFFRDRTVAEIRSMNPKKIYSQKSLIERVSDLALSEDAIELRTVLTPGRFFIGNKSGARASRLNLKHGDLLALDQPLTQKESYEGQEIPLAIIERSLSRLTEMKEEDINVIGLSNRPVQGNDKRLRVNLFDFNLKGGGIYAYSEQEGTGIELEDYGDSEKVLIEGATMIVKVPSRTKKNPKYVISLSHIPVVDVKEKRAIIWSLRADYEKTPHEIYNIKYTKGRSREGSDVVIFYPHAIAGYYEVMDKLWNSKEKNIIPFQMCPFILPAQFLVEVYKRLDNNVIIYDPSLSSKHKLRKLHLDELCIMVARTIGVFKPEKTLCDVRRDGNLRDYNWSR